MKALRIYIVEDEPLITATIEIALKKQGYTVCGDASNVDSAIAEIKKINLDLVLIDIQLEGKKDGVFLAEQLDVLGIPYLYLTSQTDPQTISKVKHTNPLGYIVKPFTETGLRSNIEIAWNNYLKIEDDYLLFSSNHEHHKVKQSQILYLKAFDNYCYVVTNDREYLVPKTLKFTSEALNSDYFAKTHRSYIVNLTKVTALKKDHIVIDTHEIPLSQSHKIAFKTLFRK